MTDRYSLCSCVSQISPPPLASDEIRPTATGIPTSNEEASLSSSPPTSPGGTDALGSACFELAFTDFSLQDLTKNHDMVISDMDLIGNDGPEIPTGPTTSIFGADQTGKQMHEMGPPFYLFHLTYQTWHLELTLGNIWTCAHMYRRNRK